VNSCPSRRQRAALPLVAAVADDSGRNPRNPRNPWTTSVE
jgi:hypothetical protein